MNCRVVDCICKCRNAETYQINVLLCVVSISIKLLLHTMTGKKYDKHWIQSGPLPFVYFFLAILQNAPGVQNLDQFWLGASDLLAGSNPGEFQWTDGTTFRYTHWETGQ